MILPEVCATATAAAKNECEDFVHMRRMEEKI